MFKLLINLLNIFSLIDHRINEMLNWYVFNCTSRGGQLVPLRTTWLVLPVLGGRPSPQHHLWRRWSAALAAAARMQRVLPAAARWLAPPAPESLLHDIMGNKVSHTHHTHTHQCRDYNMTPTWRNVDVSRLDPRLHRITSWPHAARRLWNETLTLFFLQASIVNTTLLHDRSRILIVWHFKSVLLLLLVPLLLLTPEAAEKTKLRENNDDTKKRWEERKYIMLITGLLKFWSKINICSFKTNKINFKTWKCGNKPTTEGVRKKKRKFDKRNK